MAFAHRFLFLEICVEFNFFIFLLGLLIVKFIRIRVSEFVLEWLAHRCDCEALSRVDEEVLQRLFLVLGLLQNVLVPEFSVELLFKLFLVF